MIGSLEIFIVSTRQLRSTKKAGKKASRGFPGWLTWRNSLDGYPTFSGSGRFGIRADWVESQRNSPLCDDFYTPKMQSRSAPFDHDFADLEDRREIRVIRNIGHDFFCMRTETGFEGFDRFA